jgi:hypothetical protein
MQTPPLSKREEGIGEEGEKKKTIMLKKGVAGHALPTKG